jgi:hypothetical protein
MSSSLVGELQMKSTLDSEEVQFQTPSNSSVLSRVFTRATHA